MYRVKEGDIKLPKFQRPFVWKRKDILNLCDSVYRGYPIGSILLWFTNQKLASERRIGDLEINDRPDEYPVNYLLDGQQRLSSLCGALYWDESDLDSIWNICFDLYEEEFFYPNGPLELWHFPMNKLLGTFDFIDQCKKFEAHKDREKYEATAQRLLQSIKDYKIAAVTIGDMGLDEVAPIFERINSTGRQLTIVDLMRAATWSEGFDLNKALSSVREALEAKDFDSVPEGEILKNISASAELGIHKDDVDALRDLTPDRLQEVVRDCVSAYRHAVDFLTSELPLTSYAYLPYRLQLTFLVEFFRICPTPSIRQRAELKRWFWHTSLSGYFRLSNYSFIRGVLSQIRDFANGRRDSLVVDNNIKYLSITKDKFGLGKAFSKAFALMLAHNRPRNLLDGSPVDTRTALAVTNRHEFHHIFPKNYLENEGVDVEDINMHANFCMLNLDNNRKISNKRPADYFTPLQILLGHDLEDVLASNFITPQAYQACLTDDYYLFIELRAAALQAKMQELTGT